MEENIKEMIKCVSGDEDAFIAVSLTVEDDSVIRGLMEYEGRLIPEKLFCLADVIVELEESETELNEFDKRTLEFLKKLKNIGLIENLILIEA